MKFPSKIALITMTAMMASGSISTMAYAADSSKAAADQEVVVVNNLKISGHGKAVISDVRSARVALFEGQVDAALDLVKKARDVFDYTVVNYAVKLTSSDGYGVPVDRSITLAEGFKPTKEHAEIINKAGSLAQQGKTEQAITLMKESGIDLDIQYALLPVLKNISNLEKAISDINDEKFYEANMMLKAIEASVIFEELNVEEIPQQGYQLKDIR